VEKVSSNRIERISEEVKREASQIILNELKDPRISKMISVTKAVVTKDMRYAKIYVSIMAENEEKKSVFEGLKNAAGFIRKELGSRIQLRYSPEVIFEIDDSIEYGMKISNLLKQISSTEKDDK
jgi:ribosome-binding factor A